MPPPTATAAAERERGRARRGALRRMKTGALALLLGALGLFVLTYQVPGGGSGAWGFLRAATEAGMVGGLADWFAVTAIFRRPLGLPIPHTALIPTRKDDLGRTLQAFVGDNFLTVEAVADQVARAGLAPRLGTWLAEPGHAERVAAEASEAAAAAVRLLRDDDLQVLAEETLRRRLTGGLLAPHLAAALRSMQRGGSHEDLVDLAAGAAHHWLVSAEESVIALIVGQAPGWTPRFVDRGVARRVHAELVRVLGEVSVRPDHPARVQLDRLLASAADYFGGDSARFRLDTLLARAWEQQEIRTALSDMAASVRTGLAEQLADAKSTLRPRVAALALRLGERLCSDAELQATVESALTRAAAYVVTHYPDEITAVIANTVDRWDGPETARRIELVVGRDLQFIRINGTVVGALAGVGIHAVGTLLL